MKTTILSIFIVLLNLCHVFGQDVDLAKEKIILTSNRHRMAGDDANRPHYNTTEVPKHAQENGKNPLESTITIDTKAKTVKIVSTANEKVLYDLTYYMAQQGGGNASMKLKPGETVFLVKDEKVSMLTYDETSAAFYVVWKDNQNEIFEELNLIAAE